MGNEIIDKVKKNEMVKNVPVENAEKEIIEKIRKESPQKLKAAAEERKKKIRKINLKVKKKNESTIKISLTIKKKLTRK